MSGLRWERGCEPGASLHGLLAGYSGAVGVAEIVERPAEGDDGGNSEWLWRVLYDSHDEVNGCEGSLDAARAAAEAAWAKWCANAGLASVTAWRPVETAPRDGTVVLLWCKPLGSDAWGVHLADWFSGWPERPMSSGPTLSAIPAGWQEHDGYHCAAIPEATHWQPLPGPPVVGDAP